MTLIINNLYQPKKIETNDQSLIPIFSLMDRNVLVEFGVSYKAVYQIKVTGIKPQDNPDAINNLDYLITGNVIDVDSYGRQMVGSQDFDFRREGIVVVEGEKATFKIDAISRYDFSGPFVVQEICNCDIIKVIPANQTEPVEMFSYDAGPWFKIDTNYDMDKESCLDMGICPKCYKKTSWVRSAIMCPQHGCVGGC